MRRFARWFAVLTTAAMLLAAAPAVHAATPEDARALVKATADKVLDRVTRDKEQLTRNPELIYPLVLPHFDFEKMSQWVLGANWRKASQEQRQRFTEEFRNLLVRTYAGALLEYTGQTIEYLPIQGGEEASKVVVRTQIQQKGSPYPIPINYAMYLKNGEWKVYDISVDNVSLVSNYRRSFASEIRQGSIDQLIARMETMNRKGEKGG